PRSCERVPTFLDDLRRVDHNRMMCCPTGGRCCNLGRATELFHATVGCAGVVVLPDCWIRRPHGSPVSELGIPCALASSRAPANLRAPAGLAHQPVPAMLGLVAMTAISKQEHALGRHQRL